MTAASPLRLVLLAGVCAAAMTLATSGIARALTQAEIANLSAPDRQKVLEEGAKKEGELLWYTTLQVDEASGPISKAFMAKYPFVKADVYRGTGVTIAQRLQAEFQAKNIHADLVVFNSADGRAMVRANQAEPFTSPLSKEYPAGYTTADRMSSVVRTSTQGMAYNTTYIPKGTGPETWEDLLNPKWKGKMAWAESTGTGAPFMINYFRQTMGEEKGLEFIKKLAAQDIRLVGLTARLTLDQVIAGEYQIGVSMSLSDVVDSLSKGAPLQGVLPEPVLAQTTTAQYVKGSPHPYAGMLFIDFLLSKDGAQTKLRDGAYIPAHPQVDPLEAMKWTVPRLAGKKEIVEDPSLSMEMTARSQDILKEYFK